MLFPATLIVVLSDPWTCYSPENQSVEKRKQLIHYIWGFRQEAEILWMRFFFRKELSSQLTFQFISKNGVNSKWISFLISATSHSLSLLNCWLANFRIFNNFFPPPFVWLWLSIALYFLVNDRIFSIQYHSCLLI